MRPEEKNPKNEFLREVDNMRFNKYERREEAKTGNRHAFGLCSSCNNFQFAESEFKILAVNCRVYDRVLSQQEKVKNCSAYSELGEMSLYEMGQMAYYIDDKKEKVIGFGR